MRQACAASGRMLLAIVRSVLGFDQCTAKTPFFGLISAHKYGRTHAPESPRKRVRMGGRNLTWSQFLWPHHGRAFVSFFNCQTTHKASDTFDSRSPLEERVIWWVAPPAGIHTYMEIKMTLGQASVKSQSIFFLFFVV